RPDRDRGSRWTTTGAGRARHRAGPPRGPPAAARTRAVAAGRGTAARSPPGHEGSAPRRVPPGRAPAADSPAPPGTAGSPRDAHTADGPAARATPPPARPAPAGRPTWQS